MTYDLAIDRLEAATASLSAMADAIERANATIAKPPSRPVTEFDASRYHGYTDSQLKYIRIGWNAAWKTSVADEGRAAIGMKEAA
jgi:hypothetical protein